MKVTILNFVGDPGTPLLNVEGGPGVPLLNFRGSRVPLLNFEGGHGSRGPGSWGPWSHFYTMPWISRSSKRKFQALCVRITQLLKVKTETV